MRQPSSARPAPRALALLRPALLAGAALAGAACGADSPTEPAIEPPVTQLCSNTGLVAEAPSGPAFRSALLQRRSILDTLTPRGYVAIALDSMQHYSVNAARIDWSAFRARYLERAAAVGTLRQTYPIIDAALAELDPHSSISPPDRLPGSSDAPADRPDQRVRGCMVTPRLAYLWIPGFIGRNQTGRVDTTHTIMRQLDANRLCGWIVDVRHNNGGFFFALMASVAPLYATDNGTVLGLRYNDGDERYFWQYEAGGSAIFATRLADGRLAGARYENVFRPSRPGLPVAVLIGRSAVRIPDGRTAQSITASAGESITLAFRGGPPSRTFGLPTIGVASGRYPFFMPDTARIDITDSYMFARDGFTPGDDPIRPDQEIPNGIARSITGDATDPTVAAAISWLQSRPECASGGTFNRLPGAADVVPTAPRVELVPALPNGKRRPKGPDAVFQTSAATTR